MHKIYTFLAVGLVIFIVALLGLRFSEKTVQNTSANVCDFTLGDCRKMSGENEVRLSASPTVIKAEQEAVFRLASKGFDSSYKVSGHLEGKDMYMGKIPLFFNYQDKGFVADSLIGACLEDSMIWRMKLSIEDPTGQVSELFFDFTSYQ